MAERWVETRSWPRRRRRPWTWRLEAMAAGDPSPPRALRAREARVPVHARHAGRRHGGPDLLRQGEARRRGRAPGWEWSLERAGSRRCRRSTRSTAARSPSRSRRPGAATPPALGPNPGAFEISEDEEKLTLHDQPVWVWRAACAHRPLRAARLGRHRLRPRRSYGRAGFPPLPHPSPVHERAGSDQLDRLPGLSVGTAQDFERVCDRGIGNKDPADIPDRHGKRYGVAAKGGGRGWGSGDGG